MYDDLTIAAIVPCHNEEAAVAKVVTDLRAAVPGMDIYVYDNNSTDRTVERALEVGAIVRHEHEKGKGNVVRRAFADIDADVYVMIDGDDTYDTAALPGMIDALLEGPLDHVLGVREQVSETAYRPGHEAGNRAFNNLVSLIFGHRVTDMLSGYRVFSRRFVKSFPAVSRRFEIETELTVHSSSLRVPQTEITVGFRDRAEGSESKLHTYRDGAKILSLIVHLIRHERPILFHSVLAAVVFIVALLIGVPVIADYFRTGEVARFPSAILATGLVLIAGLSWLLGFVLDGITRSRRENARLTYLRYSAPSRQHKRLAD